MNVSSQGQIVWVWFLAGPTLWFGHFMAVYLLVEAGCAAGGSDTELLGLPVLSFVTIALTLVATAAALWCGWRALRYWRARTSDTTDWIDGDDRNAGLALAGALLGAVFTVAILFVGVPAAVLDPC